MPTIRLGPYRVQFFEADLAEKPHVHIRRERMEAKFWLTPVELYRNHGFADHELNKIERLVRKNRNRLMKAWRIEKGKRND